MSQHVAAADPAHNAVVHLDKARYAAARPFVVLGGIGVIAGGLVAAATAQSPSENASWAAAYLVLVIGAAQIALGFGQAVLPPQAPSTGQVRSRALGWAIANAAVMCGTLVDVPALLYAGSALLVVTLIAFLRALPLTMPVGRLRHRGGLRQAGGLRRAWPIVGYRAIVVVLLVSTPVGCIVSAAH